MLLIPTLLCPKSWEGMAGNETQRFCGYCRKHVHNLEALSVSERLALLSSPAASICSRYKVAIRRPARGKEEAYWKHLMKYGAGVAITGSVLLVLWEMQDPKTAERHFRAVGHSLGICAMPKEYYQEHQAYLLGEVVAPAEIKKMQDASARAQNGAEDAARHVDLKLDPAAIDALAGPQPNPPEKPAPRD